MQLLDRVPKTGILAYTVRRRGVVVEVVNEKNLIVDGARNALARLLGGDVVGKSLDRIGFGTSGAAPDGDDLTLTGSFVKALGVKSYPATGKVQWTWTLGPNEANGKAIREFGLLCTDGTLFSRKTRASGAIEKDSDVDLEGTWTILL